MHIQMPCNRTPGAFPTAPQRYTREALCAKIFPNEQTNLLSRGQRGTKSVQLLLSGSPTADSQNLPAAPLCYGPLARCWLNRHRRHLTGSRQSGVLDNVATPFVGDPPNGRGYAATLPTRGPLLIFSPALAVRRDRELGRVYRTGPGLKNLSIMCSSTPISHNRALGLMAQQDASEILPILLGGLACNGWHHLSVQRSVTFEAKHPQISFCVPKEWTNTPLCTFKVTPRGAFWKISIARTG